MIEWAERIIINYQEREDTQIVLILDRCSAHLSDKLRKLL
jgi:hypothetical protein